MARWDVRAHGVIVDDETFLQLAELETRQAVRLQYPLCVLTVHPELTRARDTDHRLVATQLSETLSPLIRSTDVIGMVGSEGDVRILFVGSRLEHLGPIVRRLIAELRLHAFDDATVILSIGGSCFPETADTARALLRQADALANEVRAEVLPYSRYRLADRTRGAAC